MEGHPNVPLQILVSNLTNTSVHVRKHMLPCTSSDTMGNFIDPEQVGKKTSPYGSYSTVHLKTARANERMRQYRKHERRLVGYYRNTFGLRRLLYQAYQHAQNVPRNVRWPA